MCPLKNFKDHQQLAIYLWSYACRKLAITCHSANSLRLGYLLLLKAEAKPRLSCNNRYPIMGKWDLTGF